ncbi:hypothetical protein FSP39_012844 [Pinctada imbricata]|uniref:Protein rolling stone n=1 Tax=Pinctada imbricata TaxID=66713 RepID=A0AA89CAN4_PINIB|nr:hypothetical protein FSP39_012844 [Pinctada imbricata]
MGPCCTGCRREFRLKNFGFVSTHPARFVYFQWRCAPVIYLIYRAALMIYADTWLIFTATSFINFGFEGGNNNTSNNETLRMYSWPVYLTNWTYLLLCLYLTSHAIFSVWYLLGGPIVVMKSLTTRQQRQLFSELNTSPSLWENSYNIVLDSNESVTTESQPLPWYFKLVWILYNMASAGSVMVTAVFFIFLWPLFNTASIGQMNLQLHGINSVIVFIEHLMSGVPYRLLHYIYPLLYGLAYLTFSGIFYAAGNEDPIYPGVLDWSKPGQTMIMVVLVGFVVLPLLQIFFFVIYKIRIFIFDLLTKYDEGPSVSDEGSTYKVEET